MLFDAVAEDALRLADVGRVAVTSRAFDAVDHQCPTRDLPHSVFEWEELADFVWCSEGNVEVDLREELVDVCLRPFERRRGGPCTFSAVRLLQLAVGRLVVAVHSLVDDYR